MNITGPFNPANLQNKPMDELVFLFSKFGWETRLCDLSEKQVMALVFALQEAERIDSDKPTAEFEQAYFESTGAWPITAIPF